MPNETLMHGDSPDELILLPSLTGQRGPRGGLILTQKYLNGAAEYAKYWPGRVTSLVRIDARPTSDMDRVEIMPGETEPSIEERPLSADALQARLASAAAVAPFLCPAEAPLAELCAGIGVPVIYGSEYSPATEKQIVDEEFRNPLRRFRRKRWIDWAEKQRQHALRLAAGIQCSGTPTYEIYRHINPNALLFFDNRVRGDRVISQAALEARLASLSQRRPLRLVFGGRLIPMKGVMYLPEVAHALRSRGVEFTLDIYGTGALEQALEKRIRRLHLDEVVKLRGALGFDDWVATLQRDADLFVCCHPQGDPSSTYPEVMSCGAPIAGFANEAFTGIVEHSGSGWLAPLNAPEQLAETIARLAVKRDEIALSAIKARDFAALHAFERTFSRRTDHFVRLSRLPQAGKDRHFAERAGRAGRAGRAEQAEDQRGAKATRSAT